MPGPSEPTAVPPAGEGLREEPRAILLVEDDDGDAMIVEELLLSAWPELRIHRARTLAEAARSLSAPIDCVVLDLGLPDGVGVNVVHRMRETDGELPVVVLTGDTHGDRGIEALGAGAQDYLVKGAIDGATLARAIRHSVQRKLAERFERELAILRVQTAENVRTQRGLIPRPIVHSDAIAIHSAYRPGNRRQVLGGDFFDVIQSAPDRLHVMLGDVCGHGPDEAALGVQLRMAWRTLILAGVEHAALLRTLDRVTVQERHADYIFVTLASLELDLTEGTACLALAGHPAPIVLDAGVRLLSEGPGGLPLGVDPGASWDLRSVALGDARFTLLLYSDGLYEGYAGARGDRLGMEGLLDVLSERPGRYVARPEDLIDRVESLNGGPLADDVAVLAVTVG